MYDEKSKLACGCYPDETVGVEHDDKWTVTEIVCQRHRAIGEKAQRYHENANEADVKHGLLWQAIRDEED